MKSFYKFSLLSFFIFSYFAFLSQNSHGEYHDPEFSFSDSTQASKNFIKISAGRAHSLALDKNGNVWAWGDNSVSQLGNQDVKQSSVPIKIQGLSEIIDISAGSNHSLALDKNGIVWAWGDNSYGELGDGTRKSRSKPIVVESLSGVISIAAGGGVYYNTSVAYRLVACFSMALKKDGTVWTWGADAQIGGYVSKIDSVPQQVSVLTDITAIAAGAFHSVALREDGTVWAWGDNSLAQLGDDSHKNNDVPTQVLELKNITAISAAGTHSIALKNDSTVWTWGDKPPIYNATKHFSFIPEIIANLTGIISVSCGGTHYLALRNDGWVWSWGMNNEGQLGSESAKKNQYKLQVWKVSSLDNVCAISAGGYHNLSLKKDGTIWAWGDNGSGQIGDGTTKQKQFATKVVGLNY